MYISDKGKYSLFLAHHLVQSDKFFKNPAKKPYTAFDQDILGTLVHAFILTLTQMS